MIHVHTHLHITNYLHINYDLSQILLDKILWLDTNLHISNTEQHNYSIKQPSVLRLGGIPSDTGKMSKFVYLAKRENAVFRPNGFINIRIGGSDSLFPRKIECPNGNRKHEQHSIGDRRDSINLIWFICRRPGFSPSWMLIQRIPYHTIPVHDKITR